MDEKPLLVYFWSVTRNGILIENIVENRSLLEIVFKYKSTATCRTNRLEPSYNYIQFDEIILLHHRQYNSVFYDVIISL